MIGHKTEITESAHKIQQSGTGIYHVKYLFDLDNDYKTMQKLIQDVDYVFICRSVTEKERQVIFSHCMMQGTGIFMVPDLFDISVKNARLHTFDDTLAFRVGRLTLSWEQQAVKRLFDIVFSLLVIIFMSPVLLLVALLVKISSPGPVIFKQERITRNNQPFFVYKFRTMYQGAEDETGPVFTAEDDQRVTRIGALLRSTRIDELPQFFNVLAGDMSVVGPRPERTFFVNQFKKEFPDYEYRTTVKAGITGYAQLMGKYATSASDKLRFDLWYIKNYSLWLDITLVLQTVKVLFVKGSYGEVTNFNITNDSGLAMHCKDGYFEVG